MITRNRVEFRPFRSLVHNPARALDAMRAAVGEAYPAA